jgi:hypothetical protein
MLILDQNGNTINTNIIEKEEQNLAKYYIKPDDIVFELGARYGSVSCVINKILTIKTNQVVVEPDQRVWDALEKNKKINNCEFQIIKGFVSNRRLGLINLEDYHGGYGSTFIVNETSNIPNFSLPNLPFNVLVADCEGFLETFFDENPDFYNQLRLIIFEADYPDKCNYKKIKEKLLSLRFTKILEGDQNVFINYFN